MPSATVAPPKPTRAKDLLNEILDLLKKREGLL